MKIQTINIKIIFVVSWGSDLTANCVYGLGDHTAVASVNGVAQRWLTTKCLRFRSRISLLYITLSVAVVFLSSKSQSLGAYTRKARPAQAIYLAATAGPKSP